MKIGIICGHFMPEIGYVEVHITRAFSRLGHEVHVFTSNKWSKSVRKVNSVTSDFEVGVKTDDKYGFFVHRFKAYFSMGAMVKCRKVNQYIKTISPETLVFFGPGKLFPEDIYNEYFQKNSAILTLLGDDRHFQNKFVVKNKFDSILKIGYKGKVFILRKFLKDKVYCKAVKYSDNIMAYTPEVPEIIKNYLPQKLEKLMRDKTIFFSLGFDPDLFYFDENERREYRLKLKIEAHSKLLITCTRVNESKRLEIVMDAVNKLNQQGKDVHYLVIGLMEDNYSKEIIKYRNNLPFKNKIHTLPFMAQNELRKYYNASDFAYWPSHIISLYEAMGTGLPLVLPKQFHTKHLLTHGVNGWYFKKDLLYQTLELSYEVLDSENDYMKRKNRYQYNFDKYSFDSIAQLVLDQANKALSKKSVSHGLSN